MPHLEKDIWQKYKERGVTVLAVGREHTVAELTDFAKQQNLSMPMIADQKREIFSKYAKKGIPRTFVIDQSGKVIFVADGYDKSDFKQMIKSIAKAVGTHSKSSVSP